jgi:hypothetical protein
LHLRPEVNRARARRRARARALLEIHSEPKAKAGGENPGIENPRLTDYLIHESLKTNKINNMSLKLNG